METISIQGKTFKQYRCTKYYCDEDGRIFSDYSQKILTPMLRGDGNKQYPYIDVNFGNGQKHVPVHRIVYECWIGEIDNNLNVLHKDDDQFNNNFNNLYLGNQKENIKDCINNEHRVGNIWTLTVFDNQINKTITFCPASDFIKYCRHPCNNGAIKRFFDKNWFQKRYTIIDYYRCKSLDEKKGVTTNPDECKDVEWILSPLEVRNIS